MLIIRLLVVVIAGALGAAMANRAVAVYADGLRPIMPELMEGRMSRLELASTAFALSFGLWLGFGLSFSLASTIILVHSLWLGTDIIGTWMPGRFGEGWPGDRRSLGGLAGSLVLGGAYGALLVLGLDALAGLFQRLPVNLFDQLGALQDTIVLTFAAFPALAVAYQFGLRKGILALLLTGLAWQAASLLGQARPDLWALACGAIILLFHAMREGAARDGEASTALLFRERASRIRRNLPVIALMGAVYGVASHLAILMEGAQSATALAGNDRAAATAMTLARAAALTPIKGMTALATGVFATDGLGFVATAGLLSPNAAVALVAGALVMSLEALGLAAMAGLLDRFPALRKVADNSRAAMTRLLEVAALVGGMLAAHAMAPGLGLFVVAGLYLLNETAGTPVVRAAIGPVAAIVVAVAVNALALLGLFTPALPGAGL